MQRRLVVLLLSFAAALLHTLLYYHDEISDRLEPKSLAIWFKQRGPIAVPDNVILIALDEESYEELGVPLNEVWPREYHARVLERLAHVGAKRVAFDVLFYGASDNPEADEHLAKSLTLLPTVVGTEVGIRPGQFEVHHVHSVYPPFEKAAEQVALVARALDSDNITRRLRPHTNIAKDLPIANLPYLSEAAIGLDIQSGNRPSSRDFINFYGPRGTVETFSFLEILDPELGPDEILEEFFKDKIVFIGLALRTDLGIAQKDSFITPAGSEAIFGVEIHATAAANMLTNDWIKRFDHDNEAIGLGIATFLSTYAIFAFPPGLGFLTLVTLFIAWGSMAYSLFLQGVFIPGVLFLILLLLAYVGSTLFYYVTTYRAQKRTQQAFSMYLSPHMAKQVAQSPEVLQLGGNSVEATALFTDIAGFTSITEKMTAQEVSRMLNSYFTEVMEAIFENEGTLIKFIGDAVFAIWGAPVEIEDHAEQALLTAFQIELKVREFNENHSEFPDLHTRIGVNTGTMVVGNLGSERRFDYTAIGDAVNLSARLEGLNKYFGTTVLYSRSTKDQVSSGWSALRIGSVAVAGKEEEVEIFTSFPKSGDLTRTTMGNVAERYWNRAMEAFAVQNWDEAIENFKHVSNHEGRLARAVLLYLSEIETYKKEPPGADWSGDLRFTSK